MLASQIPAKFNIPFANSAGVGYIRTIPQSSQVSITPGAASLTDGFPPLTFTAIGAGGVPMSGQDMNGILNEITDNQQWVQAGGMAVYDSAFSSAIGGYPSGAVLRMANNNGIWVSTVDNNATNPDASGAGWIPLSTASGSYLSLSVAGSANVTLTTVQAATSIINLTGALTANINLIIPSATGEWLIANNTTGAFTVTVKTSPGTGVVATQGTANQYYCNGTNVYSIIVGITQTQADARYAALAGSSAQSFSVANAVSSSQAVNLSQADARYSNLGIAAVAYSANTTLTSSNAGQMIYFTGTTATFTLPLSNAASGGQIQMIISNQGSGTLTLAMQGGNTTDISFLSLSPTQTLAAVNDGSNVWHHLWSEVGTTGPYSVGNATTTTHAVNKGQADGLYALIRTSNVTPLLAAGSQYTYSHSLGVAPYDSIIELVCLVSELGYSIGDVITVISQWNGSTAGFAQMFKTSTTIGLQTGPGYTVNVTNKTTAASAAPTPANWAYRFVYR
jgi:hypothetical protein